MPEPYLPKPPEEVPLLFRSRADDPDTSREAAQKANKAKTGKRLKDRILKAMEGYNGVSYFTIADDLGKPPQDISSLFTELDRAGSLYRTGATEMGPKKARRLLFWLTPPEGKPENAIEASRRGRGESITASVVEHDWLDGSGCCGVLKTTSKGVVCNECEAVFQIIPQHVHENAVMMLKQGARNLAHYNGRLATDLNAAAQQMKGIK